MNEEFEKAIREKVLPKLIDITKMDMWEATWLDSGIDDFTGSSNRMKFRIQLVSEDHRIEIMLWTNQLQLPEKINEPSTEP